MAIHLTFVLITPEPPPLVFIEDATNFVVEGAEFKCVPASLEASLALVVAKEIPRQAEENATGKVTETPSPPVKLPHCRIIPLVI